MWSRRLVALILPAAFLSSCCPCRRSLGSADPAPLASSPAPTAPKQTATSKPATPSPDRARAKQFVEDVTLGAEFFGTDSSLKRWTHPIRVSVVEGSSSSLPDLRDVVSQLNAALAGTSMRVDLLPDGNKSADLWIHVAPLARFDAIATANGFQYAAGNWGYAYTFWNGQKELTKAHVLLASDKLKGAQLRHYSFEELTHCLGPLKDSAVYPDSVLYAAGANNGNATRLSATDKLLLRFIYTHTSAGFDKARLDAAFDASWP